MMSSRSNSRWGRITPLVTGVAALSAALAAVPVMAKPLDAETCQRLKADVQGLEQQGIRDLMAKGPQTARSLNAAQLDKIRMLMDLDGQVRFRCGELPTIKLKEEPPEEPQEAGAAPAKIDNSTPGITLPPGAESVGPVVPPVKRRPPAAAAAKPAAPPRAATKPGPAASVPTAPAAPSPAKSAQAPAAAKSAPAQAPTTATDVKPAPKAPPAKKIEKKPDDAYRPPAPAAKTE